jgi:hypothetical protein
VADLEDEERRLQHPGRPDGRSAPQLVGERLPGVHRRSHPGRDWASGAARAVRHRSGVDPDTDAQPDRDAQPDPDPDAQPDPDADSDAQPDTDPSIDPDA